MSTQNDKSTRLPGISIAGMEMDVQHAAALLRAAEEGCREIEALLERMLALSVQSSSGDDVDRRKLEEEFQMLKSEIDRIADSTNYKGIRLLDGNLSANPSADGTVKWPEVPRRVVYPKGALNVLK